jgi:soluble lytic murein transglycosylase-like protein
MKRLALLGWLAALGAMHLPQAALAQRAQYETMIAVHAKANLVPEALVHRVIVRESKYQASLLGHGGAIGLMQIKLATARALGYSGNAEGLRDPETNLKYGIKYLAGAYRAAGGDHDRTVHYYAAGYYFAAKNQRLEHMKQAKAGPTNAAPKPLSKDEVAAAGKDVPAAKDTPEPGAEPASK